MERIRIMAAQVIRILCEANNPSRLVNDAITRGQPFWWKGSDVRVAIALSTNGQFLTPAEIGTGTIIIEVKELSAPDSAPCLIRKTYTGADCNAGFTAADWSGGTASLLVASFTAGEAALLEGMYLLVVRFETSAGIANTYLSAHVRVIDDQSESEVVRPQPDPPFIGYVTFHGLRPTFPSPATAGDMFKFGEDGLYYIYNGATWDARATVASLGTAAFRNTGTSNGNVPLVGVDGKLPASLIPTVTLSGNIPVANEAARLALSAGVAAGKVVVQGDDGSNWMLADGGDPSDPADWIRIYARDITLDDVQGLRQMLDIVEPLRGSSWPVADVSGNYTLAATDRNMVLCGIGATRKTWNVGGIRPGQFVAIRQAGWGRITLTGGADTLVIPSGFTASLAGDGAEVLLSCDVRGRIQVSGGLEPVDPIRVACGEANFSLDLDADWGVVSRPEYEAGMVETWYSREGTGVRTTAAYPRENKFYLRRRWHPTLGWTIQTGLPGSTPFDALLKNLGIISQPYSLISVHSFLSPDANPMYYDATSPNLIRSIYYYGYDATAGAGLAPGGPLDPKWAYNSDGTAAPSSVMCIYNGPTSAIYADNSLRVSGDVGTNALQGSTFRISGDVRTLLKRLIILNNAPANPAAIMAAVIAKYNIPARS